MNTKKFTILHSNDMHGDFFAESSSERKQLIGGLSLLSGYVNKVRSEEENVLYVIAGDMLQGSTIDTEFKGISTIEIMNYLSPDIITIGNHELDYGLPHLLFLEKMANFPMVNANLYIKNHNKRIMTPYKIIKKAGLDILFTGIITDKILDALKQDTLIGSFVSLEEASSEVGKICNAYKHDDIDLTILLTHIGFESDIELAKLLNPDWGVDMIIGGHSHTVLDKPAKINNILIAQAGVGTNQIGRFDITIDDDTNSIVDYDWKLIEINDDIAEPDADLTQFIDSYKQDVDKKYGAMICKMKNELTHPKREIETTLGNLFADAIAEASDCDIVLLGSGSLRVEKFGPVVTLNDLIECFPYDDTLTRYTVTGEQLKKIFQHIMRIENRDGEGECYQLNNKVHVEYNDSKKKVISLQINGEQVQEKNLYTIALQGFHFINSKDYLNISEKELLETGPSKVISTSVQEVIEEFLRNNQLVSRKIEGRIVYS